MPRLKIHAEVLHDFPTRLIDVGAVTEPQLRLIEANDEAPKRHKYIALSHSWGILRSILPSVLGEEMKAVWVTTSIPSSVPSLTMSFRQLSETRLIVQER